jgi:hypothetical protein
VYPSVIHPFPVSAPGGYIDFISSEKLHTGIRRNPGLSLFPGLARKNLPARRLNLPRLSKGSFGGDWTISISKKKCLPAVLFVSMDGRNREGSGPGKFPEYDRFPHDLVVFS